MTTVVTETEATQEPPPVARADREAGTAAADCGASSLELAAWRGMIRVHASVCKRLDAELDAGHGLPLSSFEVLFCLDESPRGRMRMCDLAALVALSRSGLTRLVDRLEREGLIERCSCAHDARGAYACLTPEGRARLRAARDTHLQAVRRHFLSMFDADELRLLADCWHRMLPGGCGADEHLDSV
jgi:DNA-binding MarR family transcriptional regulator